MSADTEDAETDLEGKVMNFLRRNFPQIQMHGGTAAVQQIDPEEGSVTVQLGGACSGCGISPMTIQAIKSRMVKEIPEIERVNADTGMSGGMNGADGGRGGSTSTSSPFPGAGGDDDGDGGDEGPQAPF
jgi:Thioredoxin-like proteins and domains